MLITITGPSAVGKGFVKNALIQRFPSVTELTWVTTRLLRPGEQGGNRQSVSLGEFQGLEEQGELVAVQRLFGHCYGLRLEEFDASKVQLTELHIDNIEAVNLFPCASVCIAIVPDSLEFLEYRLRHVRKTESEQEIVRRLKAAAREVERIRNSQGYFDRIFEVSERNQQDLAGRVIGHLASFVQGEKE